MNDIPVKRGRGRPKGSKGAELKRGVAKVKARMKEFVRVETLADKCLEEGSVLGIQELLGKFVGTPKQRNEFLLKYTGKLSMMGYTNIEIATLFAVCPETVCHWRAELRERSNMRMAQYDQLSFVSETMDFYEEVKESSLRLANSNHVTVKERLNATSIALNAENSKQMFLQKIGFLENVKLTPAAIASSDSSIKHKLLGIAKGVFDETSFVEPDEPDESSETCFTETEDVSEE
jgi:hypothetical protein